MASPRVIEIEPDLIKVTTPKDLLQKQFSRIMKLIGLQTSIYNSMIVKMPSVLHARDYVAAIKKLMARFEHTTQFYESFLTMNMNFYKDIGEDRLLSDLLKENAKELAKFSHMMNQQEFIGVAPPDCSVYANADSLVVEGESKNMPGIVVLTEDPADKHKRDVKADGVSAYRMKEIFKEYIHMKELQEILKITGNSAIAMVGGASRTSANRTSGRKSSNNSNSSYDSIMHDIKQLSKLTEFSMRYAPAPIKKRIIMQAPVVKKEAPAPTPAPTAIAPAPVPAPTPATIAPAPCDNDKILQELKTVKDNLSLLEQLLYQHDANDDKKIHNLYNKIVELFNIANDTVSVELTSIYKKIEELRNDNSSHATSSDLVSLLDKFEKLLNKNAGKISSEELDSLRKELAACKKELDEEQGHIKVVEADRVNLHAQLIEAKKETNKIKKELENLNNSSQKEIEKLQNALKEIMQKEEAIQKELDSLKTNLEEIKVEKKELQKKLAEKEVLTQQEINELKKDIEDYKRKEEEYERTIDEQQNKLSDAREEAQRLKAQLAEANSTSGNEIGILREELAASKQREEELNSIIEEQKNDLAKEREVSNAATELNKSLEASLTKAKEELQAAHEESERLRGQLNDLGNNSSEQEAALRNRLAASEQKEKEKLVQMRNLLTDYNQMTEQINNNVRSLYETALFDMSSLTKIEEAANSAIESLRNAKNKK